MPKLSKEQVVTALLAVLMIITAIGGIVLMREVRNGVVQRTPDETIQTLNRACA